MRKNPERTAWTILLLTFLLFCLCTVSIPLGIRTYVVNASTVLTSSLTSIRGTVLARPVRDEQAIPLTRGTNHDVDELTIVFTDDSQAVLTFFDQSVVTLYNNTTLIVQKTRRPRFRFSPRPEEIHIEVVKGRIRAGVAETTANRRFTVKTPHAEAVLGQGSYAVEATNGQTQITTRAGTATVTAQGQTVTVAESELTTIGVNEPPAPATAAEQNLLVNGDFSDGLSGAWAGVLYVPADPITGTQQAVTISGDNVLAKVDTLNAVTTTLKVVPISRQAVLEFNSHGTDNVHTEASIRQDIDKDVQDFQSLRINAQIRLNYQSLPGGGQLGTEFPLMIQLAYRDADGNDRNWFHGFYYTPPPNNYILYNEPDNSGESIAQFLWYPYESENLLARLGAAKPAYVKYIRIYASGWIYDAMITDVKLLAKD